MRFEEIGEQLRAYRLESGLKADEIAARLGISRAALYRYEKGEVIKLDTVRRLAEMLQVSPLALLGIGVDYFSRITAFLERLPQIKPGCLVTDVRMPGMSGLELQVKLNERHSILPIIFITGHGDVPMAVAAALRRPGKRAVAFVGDVVRGSGEGVERRQVMAQAARRSERKAMAGGGMIGGIGIKAEARVPPPLPVWDAGRVGCPKRPVRRGARSRAMRMR